MRAITVSLAAALATTVPSFPRAGGLTGAHGEVIGGKITWYSGTTNAWKKVTVEATWRAPLYPAYAERTTWVSPSAFAFGGYDGVIHYRSHFLDPYQPDRSSLSREEKEDLRKRLKRSEVSYDRAVHITKDASDMLAIFDKLRGSLGLLRVDPKNGHSAWFDSANNNVDPRELHVEQVNMLGEPLEYRPPKTSQSLWRGGFFEHGTWAPGSTSSSGRWDAPLDADSAPDGEEPHRDWVEWSFELQKEAKKVTAVAGAPSQVERGQRVRLDGSGSRGQIQTFRWTASAPRCPDGEGKDADPIDHQGAIWEITVLCDLDLTLTVSDGKEEANAAHARITVRAREWKTPLDVAPEVELRGYAPLARVCPDQKPGRPVEYCTILYGGSNACSCGDTTSETHLLHPDPNPAVHKTLDGTGYVIEDVKDPDGPFDGWRWLKEYRVRLQRQARVNRFIRPDSPPPLVGLPRNFFAENAARKNDAAGYLAAVRAHEGDGGNFGGGFVHGHLSKTRDWLKKDDPAAKLEKLVGAAGTNQEDLAARADKVLRKAEVSGCKATSDPINPPAWSGNLVTPKDDGSGWILAPAKVGGPNYSAPGPQQTCDSLGGTP
jgi:hypothetical protein